MIPWHIPFEMLIRRIFRVLRCPFQLHLVTLTVQRRNVAVRSHRKVGGRGLRVSSPNTDSHSELQRFSDGLRTYRPVGYSTHVSWSPESRNALALSWQKYKSTRESGTSKNTDNSLASTVLIPPCSTRTSKLGVFPELKNDDSEFG